MQKESDKSDLEVLARQAEYQLQLNTDNGNNEALNLYEQLISIYPHDWRGWSGKGIILFRLGEHKESLPFFDQSLQIDPNNAQVLNNKGGVLYLLKQYHQALACFDLCLRADPSYVWAWHNQALALGELKRYKSAIESIDHAIALGDQSAGVLHSKGIFLLRSRRYQEANTIFDQVIAVAPTSFALAPTLAGKAATLYNLRLYNDALRTIDQSLELNHQLEYSWRTRGDILTKLHRQQESLLSYESAYNIQPTDSQSSAFFFRYLLLSGKWQRAYCIFITFLQARLAIIIATQRAKES